ncbi:transglutaminase [Acinetobacter sp. NCu2D-2]|uniref:transglutaminase family protein n=1 Tax=Acinetobacter sp. NCu2D-2 TaxID=1608473 RepID=UPI0007CDDE00|nr:DUF3488 and transglutaminase-like domain-containing protein [Acinetobacter sp. NCu2D-2]ANF81520.1 transglutaminase [Acinetobacter sp. NCu2D-2]
MNKVIQTPIFLSLAVILLLQATFLAVPLTVVLVIQLVTLIYTQRKQRAVNKVITFSLTLSALGVIYLNYKSFIGVDAGVSVLTSFLFAKALESKNKRDSIILFNFSMFVAASSFLLSQSIWMAMGVLISLLINMLGLYRIQTNEFDLHQQSNASFRKVLSHDLKHVARLISLAVPFFILLFIFFPRLPPLWHIPIPENKAVTGISDTMSPGDIASLSQSSALAFRIVGDVSQLPNRSNLYWRALVLDQYDGQRWTSSFANQQPQLAQVTGAALQWDYQYIAADPSVSWVMGLDKSVPLERRFYNRQDWGIEPRRLTQRIEPIPLRWLGERVTSNVSIPPFVYQINTKYLQQYDPNAQRLAIRLYQESDRQPERYIQNVLQWYRDNGFVYTLNPGLLGTHRIDDFLFNSREGFCEHYASSFVMLMRYVGIPARVVTGYQGGQLSPDGKTWEVRQLDAHAWTEVLIDGTWKRFDPTSVISAQRIDEGMQNLLEQDNRVLGNQAAWSAHRYQLLRKMRIWSDYASYQWQSKVVGYTAESQQRWFEKLGVSSSYRAILMMVLGIAFFIAVYIGIYLLQQRNKISVAERLLHQFNKKLDQGLKRQHSETIQHWFTRLAESVDIKHADAFNKLSQLYARLQYSAQPMSKKDVIQLKKLFKYCTHVLKNN